MAEFAEALAVIDLKNGEMKEVSVRGRKVLVAMVGAKFFAADSACPHMGARLVEGKLDGTIVTCPRHGSRFDLRDGRVVRWTDWTGIMSAAAKLIRSPRPITTYATRVEGDKVLVEV